jgi:transketolase
VELEEIVAGRDESPFGPAGRSALRRWVPFSSTFAAFLTLAYDFIRMAAIARANLRLSGSHPGVSIGEDGPSQMALEDIAALRTVHGSTVLHPGDRRRVDHGRRARARGSARTPD